MHRFKIIEIKTPLLWPFEIEHFNVSSFIHKSFETEASFLNSFNAKHSYTPELGGSFYFADSNTKTSKSFISSWSSPCIGGL